MIAFTSGCVRFVFAVLVFIAVCAVGPHADALTIIPTFSGTIPTNANAAQIKATINSCIAEYEAALKDPIVVNITFVGQTNGLGGSGYNPLPVPYSGYRTSLVSHATTSEDTLALSQLPNTTTNPVNGATLVRMLPTLALQMGLATNAAAGTISLNIGACNVNPETDTNSGSYSLFAVTCHEIDEVLGTGGAGSWLDGTNGTPAPTDAVGPLDLFRYSFSSGVGTRSFNTLASTVCYFSIDGTNSLVQFNQNAAGDFGDFASGTPLVQNAFASPGAQPVMSLEWNMLDVAGYNWNGHTNVWSSAAAPSGAGTVYSPAPFSSALTLAPAGGVILMKTGTYSHPGRISKICKLKAVNGIARVQ